MESPTPQFTPVEQPKKSNTGLIIGIVVVVLLCCCCLVVIAGLTFLGPVVNNVFSSVNQGLENPTVPGIPAVPNLPSMPSETEIPGMPTISPDAVPQGGLGDDVLRANTWAQVLLAVMLKDPTGCTAPSAAETAISVLQKPDSDGVWKEQWTVACGAGKTVPVDVTFTPGTSGVTDISITVTK
jgi:hypothetical protein